MQRTHDIPVAILAGGRATRLGALAAETPKALMPVAGRPFIDVQLARLARSGIRRVILCIGHLGDQIKEHVGDGHQHGLAVRYSSDGPALQGTAGALRAARALIEHDCWVLYGDSYLQVEFATLERAFATRPEAALMTVFRNRGRWDTSNVTYINGQVARYDKRSSDPSMEFIDYGASLLRAEALERIPGSGPYDLAELFSGLANEGRLAGAEVHERFYEIGSPAGLAELDAHLRSEREHEAPRER